MGLGLRMCVLTIWQQCTSQVSVKKEQRALSARTVRYN